jgi:hypothetical protein
VRGTFSIRCYDGDGILPAIRGTWTLELRGRGIVYGSFTDTGDGVMEEINGEISDSGLANGSTRSTLSTTAWSTKFVRAGNALKIENPHLAMAPFAEGVRCDPGVIQQQ